MLPKAQRLTTEDFKKIRGGKTVHTPHLIFRLTSVPKGTEKSAVIVSSSSYKKAVDRNLLRRRLYSIIAENFSLRTGFTLTVTCKKGARAVPFADLQKEFTAALTKRAL